MIALIIWRMSRVLNFIQQKSPTSISGEMNANEAYNSAGVQTHAELGGMKFNSSPLKPPADVKDFEGS